MSTSSDLDQLLAEHTRLPEHDTIVRCATLMRKAVDVSVRAQDFQLASDLGYAAVEALRLIPKLDKPAKETK